MTLDHFLSQNAENEALSSFRREAFASLIHPVSENIKLSHRIHILFTHISAGISFDGVDIAAVTIVPCGARLNLIVLLCQIRVADHFNNGNADRTTN